MKALKLFLTGLLSAMAMTAMAQEPINIIVSLPPGGLSERINLAFKDELEKNGYKTNLVRFDNCKGLENWVKANTEPRTPGEEGLKDLRAMMAIYEAAKTGKTVTLNG
jgi:predicted dehydrogenase